MWITNEHPFAATLFVLGFALSSTIAGATGLNLAPSPLLSIDQNRATVVERIVAQWGDPLANSGAGLTKPQLQTLLAGLRSDQLLAASLAGSLDGLRDVVAKALTATTTPIAPGLIHTKALGDPADDLVYTPVVPCRIVDTRVTHSYLGGNSGREFKVWVASGGFTAQGGSSTNCNIPPNPAAVALNITALNVDFVGNLTAIPTGSPLTASTSVLNYQPGTFALSNGAIVPACVPNCQNQIAIYANVGGADVVIDIVGYFKAPVGGFGDVSISGNLTLVESTATAGNILKASGSIVGPFIHDFGTSNTFIGLGAGNFTMSSFSNTGVGTSALSSSTTGPWNTAVGAGALHTNTNGPANTAVGADALGTLGSNNGGGNTAAGYAVLGRLATGSNNIAIGAGAGSSLTAGDNNIYIGNVGVEADSNTIRIGDSNQTRTFIAGIRGVTTAVADGVAVVVDSAGQLGTISSARRFKDDIADMNDASAALMKLRPVTFHYKGDGSPSGRRLQYGLIAEEVAESYPELVARSADGRIETLMYQFLPPMLLNEYQKQQRTIEAQAAAIAKQGAEIAELRSALEVLMARTSPERQMAHTR